MHTENHSLKKVAAIASMAASGWLAAGKFIVGSLTGSLGIISEAIHSLVDFFATIITFFAIRFWDMPADEDHHYGHEKIESLAALVETGLLFATSAWIIYEAIERLLGAPSHVDVAWYAIAIISISIVVDFFRARNLMKVAKMTNSQALEADALHFSSDMWSSMAVLIGLIGVYFGFQIADVVAALIVSVMVARAGYELGKKSVEVLIDTAPPGSREQIEAIVAGVSGVEQVLTTRVRTFEWTTLAAEICVAMKGTLLLSETVAIKKHIASVIRESFPRAHVVVHADIS